MGKYKVLNLYAGLGSNIVYGKGDMENMTNNLGIDISEYTFGVRKDKLVRNCVNPLIGEHILKEFKKSMKNEEIN